MSRKTTTSDLSSSDFNDETSSIDSPKRKSASKRSGKKESIKNYVANLLTKQETDEEPSIDLAQTQIKVDTQPKFHRDYENRSAFRQYQAQRNSSSDEEPKTNAQTEHVNGNQVNYFVLFYLFLGK